jgi:hypothetical protein
VFGSKERVIVYMPDTDSIVVKSWLYTPTVTEKDVVLSEGYIFNTVGDIEEIFNFATLTVTTVI